MLTPMLYDLVLKNVRTRIEMDEATAAIFTAALTPREIPRKTLLLKEGQSCKYFYFVNSGAVRAYILDKDNKESTIMFAMQDWWVTDMYCFLHEKPAMMYMETIEDSTLLLLSKKDLDSFLKSLPGFEKFFRILMQNAYTREQLRMMENLSLSAAERYDRFQIKYPQIARTVTQKSIASYLGITPEFLSTIRKNKRDKNKT